MAELLIKIGDRSNRPHDYKDGDILVAVNDYRIHRANAQSICHIDNTPFNSDGIRESNSLNEDMKKSIYQYRFERVSSTEVKRTNQLTLEEEIFSNIPNNKNEYIYVEQFIRNARKNKKHHIFGKKDREVWYGGSVINSQVRLDLLWSLIEAKTGILKSENSKYPMGDMDLKSHLAVTVSDFTEEERQPMISVETDKNPALDDKRPSNERSKVVRLRRGNIDWRSLFPSDEARILNKNESVDLRNNSFNKSDIVLFKDRLFIWSENERRGII